MKHLLTPVLLFLPLAISGQSFSPAQFSQTTGDLIFTEIMADPDPSEGLPVQEYCEIYNRGATAIDLTDWIFYDGSAKALPSLVVLPGEYIIICDDDDTAQFAAYGRCASVTSISLTNSGEKLSLRNASGQPIDSVTFSDEWFGSSIKKDGGWSLERVDANFDCPISANWLPSLDITGGTPGKINSVNGVIYDETPPVLIRGYCTDSVSLILVFMEPLDPDQAIILQHYSLSNLLQPLSIEFDDPEIKKIKLTLDTPMQPGIIYTATVTGVTDCAGNKIQAGTHVKFGICDTSFQQELVINEILFNPFTGGSDFIELYHNGTGIVDLSTIKLISFDLETGLPEEAPAIQDEPFLVFPGDFIVITENSNAVASQYRSSYPFNFVTMKDLPSLNVDEGHIAIMQNEKIIDSFHYFESYHFDLIQDVKGISLEKINPKLQSGDPESWHSAAGSVGFATPGLINSEYASINQSDNSVQLSPEIFSPNNDGIDDVLTISLHTGHPGYILNTWIYSTDGKIIYDHAKNTMLATNDFFTWDGITTNAEKAPVGIYIAVVEVFNLDGNISMYKLPFVLATKL